jgi:hypothetical protein
MERSGEVGERKTWQGVERKARKKGERDLREKRDERA